MKTNDKTIYIQPSWPRGIDFSFLRCLSRTGVKAVLDCDKMKDYSFKKIAWQPLAEKVTCLPTNVYTQFWGRQELLSVHVRTINAPSFIMQLSLDLELVAGPIPIPPELIMNGVGLDASASADSTVKSPPNGPSHVLLTRR